MILKQEKKILTLWGKYYNCKWIQKHEIFQSLLRRIRDDERALPTPLSIKSFTISTSQTSNFDELWIKLTEKSHETSKSFSKEIRSMTLDKILFLAFTFLTDGNYMPPGILNEKYDLAVAKLKLKNVWSFEKLIEWFQGDKIDFSLGFYNNNESISFSHPSYSEAFQETLVTNNMPTRINTNVVCPLLFVVAEDLRTSYYAIRYLDNYFSYLKKDTREQLLLLLQKNTASYSARLLTTLILKYIDNIPVELSEKILLGLIRSNRSVNGAAEGISTGFKILPLKYREKILLEISQNRLAGISAARILRYCYDIIEEESRISTISNLLNEGSHSRSIAHVILTNMSHIKDEERKIILNLILQNVDAIEEFTKLLTTQFFNEIERDLMNNLIVQLADHQVSAWYISGCLLKNYKNFDKKIRNILILKLLTFDDSVGDIGSLLVRYPLDVPLDFRNQLLDRICEKPTGAWRLSRELIHNYSNLLKEFREDLLIRLSTNPLSKPEIAEHMDEILKFLPDDLKIKIFSALLSSDSCKGFVIRIVLEYYDNLPLPVKSIILKLKDDPSVKGDIAWGLALHFDKFPIEIQSLLPLLKNNLYELLDYFVQYGNLTEKKNVLEIISKCKTIIEEKLLSRILRELINDDDDMLRLNANNLLNKISNSML